MKRNVIKALVLLFVLLAIFAVSGCERDQGGEGYTKEVIVCGGSVEYRPISSGCGSGGCGGGC